MVASSELRRHLKTKLPDYMIPSAFVTIAALPLTPNGKLDQQALPEFEETQQRGSDRYVPPRNELEKSLIQIWTEVLKVEEIGVLDNFFDLGGHSLLAAKVIARVRRYLGVEVPLRILFEEPTVAGLASSLANARADSVITNSPTVLGRSGRSKREQLEARLRALSDDEIDALLTAALAHREEAEGQLIWAQSMECEQSGDAECESELPKPK